MIEFTFEQILTNLLLAARWTIVLSLIALLGGGVFGAALTVAGIARRANLRRHLRDCEGCRTFRAEVAHQLSIFVANKPGVLGKVCDLLKKEKINIYAITTSDNRDYSLIRLVVYVVCFVNVIDDVFELFFAHDLFVKALCELFFIKDFIILNITCHKFLFCSAGIVRPFWRCVRHLCLKSQ